MEAKSIGVKKRQQIANANRTMFLWVTGISVVIGFALVLSIFLGQKILFGEKVLAQKNKTVATLEVNQKIISELQNNIRVLDTNQGLKDTRLNDSDRPIQSVRGGSGAGSASILTGIVSGGAGLVNAWGGGDGSMGGECTRGRQRGKGAGGMREDQRGSERIREDDVEE